MPPAPATSPSPPSPARFCGAAGNLQFCDRVDDEVVGSTPTSGGGMGSRDWSLIPADLLDLIATKSADVEDYVRFRAVCKPWRSATKPTNPKLPPSLPWLLLTYNPDDPFRRFYSLSRRKFYTFHLPETLHRILWGTSHGCLLMADESFSLSLLNPLTRSLIHLPAITSFPKTSHYQFLRAGDALILQYVAELQETVTLLDICGNFSCYAFTSEDNQCFVVVLVCGSSQLLYCKVGGTGTATAWTMLHSPSEDSLRSVAYHNRQFYALNNKADIVFWDVGSTETEGMLVKSPLRTAPRFTPKGSYGMVAFGGELIVVASIYENDDEVLAVKFVTCKLTENGWSNLEDIGDSCMFMLFNSEDPIVMGVGGDCVAGWRRNSIYVADVYKDDWLETFPLHQIYVVSMQEKAFTLSTLPSISNEVFPPMWTIPSLLC